MSWSNAFASFASVRQTLNFHFSLTGRSTQESTMSSSSEETRTKDIPTLKRPDKKNRDSDSKTEDGTPSVGVSSPNSTPSDDQSQEDGAVSEGAITSFVAPSIANSIVAIVNTPLSGEPSVELNESLKKAANFSDRFKTAYERRTWGEIYIRPILENWIFFRSFHYAHTRNTVHDYKRPDCKRRSISSFPGKIHPWQERAQVERISRSYGIFLGHLPR